MPRLAASLLLIGTACIAAGSAWARTSDRNQPMDIDAANQQCILDDNGTCTFAGDVVITQGSMNIRAAKAVIHRRDGDASRAVLTGGPVVLKQLMDDGSAMTARANNVDYDLKSETVIFTGNVSIEQPRGTMSGQRVVYDMKSGRVDSGGQGNGRVRMTIQPKNKGQG